MKTGIVKMSDIAAEQGHPLDANYWLTKRPGESYETWQHRQAAIASVRQTIRQLESAQRKLATLLTELESSC